mmetsp:Transcript_18484/g.65420  ORF Transcript_18484/g.65420 Transcript_18484/m.65420 type:complete len:241 (-) Transcript_18484:209-931(-)
MRVLEEEEGPGCHRQQDGGDVVEDARSHLLVEVEEGDDAAEGQRGDHARAGEHNCGSLRLTRHVVQDDADHDREHGRRHLGECARRVVNKLARVLQHDELDIVQVRGAEDGDGQREEVGADAVEERPARERHADGVHPVVQHLADLARLLGGAREAAVEAVEHGVGEDEEADGDAGKHALLLRQRRRGGGDAEQRQHVEEREDGDHVGRDEARHAGDERLAEEAHERALKVGEVRNGAGA